MNSKLIYRARALVGVAGAALLLLGVTACKNPAEPEPAGIRVVSAAGVSDSITAFLPEPLVVEVRDSAGQRLRGVTVRFEANLVKYRGFDVPSAYLSASTPDNYREAAETVTDATGRAAVRVRLGVVAGPSTIRITVPTMGFSGSAGFTAVPGATVLTRVAPGDTAVYTGGTYTLAALAEDRFGNTRAAPVGAAVSEAPAVAAVANGSVTGQAIGRARIMVTAGGAQVPVFVSVVPQGTLAAARADGVYVFGLDGSGYRRVAAAQGARSPRWFPDGQRFVFSTGLGHAWVSDLDGVTRPLVQGQNPLEAELWPHPSRDGQWVYFGGYSGGEFRGYPYRVRADGTGLQLVPGFTADNFTQAHPSTSPAGDRVAYFREEGSSRIVSLRVLNMTTGQVVLRDVPGHSPEWSHGDSIAYLDMQGGEWGPIRLMSSTGAGRRQLGTGTSYDFGIDWSPNDQWLVARDLPSGYLEIIRVATGERIPLPFTTHMWDPAWKP
jgi:hypothetical protein